MTDPFGAPPTGGAAAFPPPPPGAVPPTPGAVPPPPGTGTPPPAPPAAPAPPVAPSEPPAPPTAPAVPPAPPEPSAPPSEPAAAEPSARDQDLDDLLDRLHDEMDLTDSGRHDVGDELTDARDLERPDGDSIVIERDGGLDFDPTFASIPARVIGLLVDLVIVNLAVAPGVALIALGGSTATTLLGLLVIVVAFAATMIWAVRSITRTGRWIGNRVARTTVVDARHGQFLDVGAAAGRMLTRHLISPVLLIGFLPALVDPSRRTFHDRVATSVVIGRQREVWTPGPDS